MNIALLVSNIAALALAIYLSVSGRSQRLRRLAWIAFLLITSVTIYGHLRESGQPQLHLGLIGPNLSLDDALGHVRSSVSDFQDLSLIDAIGSYYTCIEKPRRVFHQFGEWLLVFRQQRSDSLVEYRVSDSRLPAIPHMDLAELDEYSGGHIAQHIKFKVSPQALGIPGTEHFTGNDVVVILDERGRSLIEIWGSGPRDRLEEIVESPNTFAVCRSRIVGRPTDLTSGYTVVGMPDRIAQIVIRRAELQNNAFYDGLRAIDVHIGVSEAIQQAAAAGAKPIAPGKFAHSGGPGVVRLYNGSNRNVSGLFWQLPFRISIRPILVDGRRGIVYAVDNEGEYATSWEDKLEVAPSLRGGRSGVNGVAKKGRSEPASPRFPDASCQFTELAESDAKVVRDICADVLKKFFNVDILAWQETTYFMLPDDDGGPTMPMQRLDPPAKVMSVLGYGFFSKATIVKAVLESQVLAGVGSFGGKDYQVLEVSVFVEAGGGGGTMGNPIDKVTIFPRRVRIE